MESLLLVFCTFPDVASARQIGTALVERQLAACVNLLPAVESVYRWQGKVESAAETLAIFKTTSGAFPDFQRALSEEHPYEVPEIVAVQPAAVAGTYGKWVADSLQP